MLKIFIFTQWNCRYYFFSIHPAYAKRYHEYYKYFHVTPRVICQVCAESNALLTIQNTRTTTKQRDVLLFIKYQNLLRRLAIIFINDEPLLKGDVTGLKMFSLQFAEFWFISLGKIFGMLPSFECKHFIDLLLRRTGYIMETFNSAQLRCKN